MQKLTKLFSFDNVYGYTIDHLVYKKLFITIHITNGFKKINILTSEFIKKNSFIKL